MNNIDLNKCTPGQKLRRRDGLLMEYVERNTSLSEHFPHRVKHTKLSFVEWYTDAGKISIINPEESQRDIVKIIEMNKLNDGGPAFPHVDVGAKEITNHNGMSLRAYFAAQALPWCLHEFAGNSEDMTQPAEAAVQIADAIIRELEKGKQ